VRRLLSLLLLAALAGALPSLAAAGTPRAPRASIFFYPWYGTPGLDGAYLHWGQNGHAPPGEVASAFYPARGLYSSGDAHVLAAQMREIRSAGLDEIITSWWGWGSLEDLRLQAVLTAARANGLTVAVHIEPYGGRTPTSVAADVGRLRTLGIVDYYVFGAQDVVAGAWAAIAGTLPPDVRLFAQTGMAGYAAAARFDGLYTYDTLIYTGNRFARLCQQARRQGLVCAPSVGPGYDARRAVGDIRVKPRRAGRTYDEMWSAALAAGADAVTITSYNEWHEGSQIEPARVNGAYLSYEGAWGRVGKAAQRAYLDRTGFWADRLRTFVLAARTR
jgi:glycoprotein endo-alpha-1,2-mannosidase